MENGHIKEHSACRISPPIDESNRYRLFIFTLVAVVQPCSVYQKSDSSFFRSIKIAIEQVKTATLEVSAKTD